MVCSNLPSSGPKLCSNAWTSVRFDHQFFLKRQHQQAWNLLWNFSSWSSVCESELLTMEHLHKKRPNMFIGMERLDSFCSDALWLPVGFQGGRGEERFWSFEMTYTLSIESNVLQSFTIWGNPLLSWPFLFILGLPFSLLCVYYWTNILYNVVIYHL